MFKDILKFSGIFLLIITFFESAKAQIYHPFPTDSAEWSRQVITWPIDPVTPKSCYTYHYGLYGDTIIDGIRYSRLFANNYGGTIDTTFNIQTAKYIAGVREDTIKKVWVRMPGDSIDILYYDFSLGLGDTFCFEYFGFGCYFTVNYIDSVFVDNAFRRKLNFSNGDSWIEGLGSTVGWFTWPYVGSFENYVSCFKENERLIYGGNCHCESSSGIVDPPEKFIQIFPNPVSDQLNIYIKDDTFFDIEIHSVTGAVHLVLPQIKHEVEINLSHLPAGVYFIKIKNLDYQVTRKIFKN